MALYEVSGRQFSGLCVAVVRPCQEPCRCWAGDYGVWNWVGGWWHNESGRSCGCGSVSRVKLAGYPVREIVQVKIDGVVVDPASYDLRSWRYLVRMDDPGPPYEPRVWPACQNMALEDTQPGTFSVQYRYGVDPPALGKDAAAALACQFVKACQGGSGCVLPSGATRVTREGVTVERQLLQNWFDPKKATGIVPLDTFLAAYWPSRSRRRAAVFSPDVQQYPQRVT